MAETGAALEDDESLAATAGALERTLEALAADMAALALLTETLEAIASLALAPDLADESVVATTSAEEEDDPGVCAADLWCERWPEWCGWFVSAASEQDEAWSELAW